MVLFLFDVFFPPVFYFGCIKKKNITKFTPRTAPLRIFSKADFAINCLQMNNFGGGQQAAAAALSNNSGTPASTKAASKVPNFFSKRNNPKNCCFELIFFLLFD